MIYFNISFYMCALVCNKWNFKKLFYLFKLEFFTFKWYRIRLWEIIICKLWEQFVLLIYICGKNNCLWAIVHTGVGLDPQLFTSPSFLRNWRVPGGACVRSPVCFVLSFLKKRLARLCIIHAHNITI